MGQRRRLTGNQAEAKTDERYKLCQEVEAYIKAHEARGRADRVYFNAPPD
jgi:hypothetical protein